MASLYCEEAYFGDVVVAAMVVLIVVLPLGGNPHPELPFCNPGTAIVVVIGATALTAFCGVDGAGRVGAKAKALCCGVPNALGP